MQREISLSGILSAGTVWVIPTTISLFIFANIHIFQFLCSQVPLSQLFFCFHTAFLSHFLRQMMGSMLFNLKVNSDPSFYLTYQHYLAL
jgi:hypothetical protein